MKTSKKPPSVPDAFLPKMTQCRGHSRRYPGNLRGCGQKKSWYSRTKGRSAASQSVFLAPSGGSKVVAHYFTLFGGSFITIKELHDSVQGYLVKQKKEQ
ncbi:MAG: hypothetical protein WCL61_02485 [bacterium]